MHSVCVAHQQDLSRIALVFERSDYNVLPEIRNVNSLNRANTIEPLRRFGQQINRRAAAFNIT